LAKAVEPWVRPVAKKRITAPFWRHEQVELDKQLIPGAD